MMSTPQRIITGPLLAAWVLFLIGSAWPRNLLPTSLKPQVQQMQRELRDIGVIGGR